MTAFNRGWGISQRTIRRSELWGETARVLSDQPYLQSTNKFLHLSSVDHCSVSVRHVGVPLDSLNNSRSAGARDGHGG